MKKNRLIACITILTIILTLGLGNLGILLSSYAQEKNNLIITEIINEKAISTPDDKLTLDQNIEKISDTELKVNLNIKSLSENIDLKNVCIVNTLSDSLEINSDSVSVLGIENANNTKGEITSPRDTVTISLGDISSKEVNISFLAKIRNSAEALKDIPLNLRVDLNYTSDNDEDKVYSFPVPKFTLKEVIIDNEKLPDIKPEINEDNLQQDTPNQESNDKLIPEIITPVQDKTTQPNVNSETNATENLQLNKKAEENEDGTFKITLEVKGTSIITEGKDADIVMIIDKSGSMLNKESEVKDSAKKFSENILNNATDNQVRIAIASFCLIDKYTNGGSSTVETDFTTDISTVNSSIDRIAMGGGTHTQDGIWTAADLMYGARPGVKKYVVFFTDGVPTASKNSVSPGDDIGFKEAQKEYYHYFTGYGSPTQVTIGGIGYNPTEEILYVNNNPVHKDTKFYSLGLFVDPVEGERKNAINFLKTIQNVIEPSKFGDKYYTEDINTIDNIFMEISNDINKDISETVINDLVVHDIVTKEFNIVPNSLKVTDLKNNEITIPSEDVAISQTEDGCDEITINVGDVLSETDSLEGGVRVSFDIATKDPYFSGDNIKTNISADITSKHPITGEESSKDFIEDPTVNISPKQGNIKVTKNVKNSLGDIITDDTPFEIIIERIGDSNDPEGIVSYNKTYTLKSKEFNNTGNKHLIGPNTVSPDGSVVLSTDINNKDNYLIAGEYNINEINIPQNYAMQQIKVNGVPIDNDSTFTLSKDTPSIDIEVINKKTITNDLIKNKTATQVLDDDNNPTGEYEISLNVNTPQGESTTWMYDNVNINYHEYNDGPWEIRTTGTLENEEQYKVASGNGNTISFEFEGTGFTWFGQGNDGEYTDTATITIDGGTYNEIRVEDIGRIDFSTNAGEKIVYSKNDLPYGRHTVDIQFWEKYNNTENIMSIKKLLLYTDSSGGNSISDTTITDVITEYFEIVADGYGKGKTAVIEKPSGVTAIDIDTTIGTKTINGKTYDSLTWNNVDIDSRGITIKFKVKPKDEYYGGDNIYTNVEATVEYITEGITNKEYFNKPTVDIPYKKGSITIRKDIVTKNNSNIWNTILNSEINSNDKFSISVIGNQRYTVDLNGNSHQSFNFYLKGKDTDISTNTDTSLNYFTEGLYTIEEILPMNYEQVDIYIDQTPYADNPTWMTLNDYVNDKSNIESKKAKDGKIFINKYNSDINIKVTNTLVNDSYFQDKSDALNKFNYNPNN